MLLCIAKKCIHCRKLIPEFSKAMSVLKSVENAVLKNKETLPPPPLPPTPTPPKEKKRGKEKKQKKLITFIMFLKCLKVSALVPNVANNTV